MDQIPCWRIVSLLIFTDRNTVLELRWGWDRCMKTGMSEQSDLKAVGEPIKIESIFVRHRNVLAVRGSFSDLFADYYVHLMDHKIKYEERLDTMLKNSLATLTLHLVARPWRETIAWTVNMRAPRINLFVTGGSLNEFITGRIFTEDVREPDRNLLYSQTLATAGAEARTSMIEVEGGCPTEWIEHYYEQSEQRPGKCFELPNEEFILFAAQPDYDQEWFDSLNEEKALTFLKDEETKVLETRKFRFHCGCSVDKILPALAGYKDKPEELFQGDAAIKVQCPRCAASYEITQEQYIEFNNRED